MNTLFASCLQSSLASLIDVISINELEWMCVYISITMCLWSQSELTCTQETWSHCSPLLSPRPEILNMRITSF